MKFLYMIYLFDLCFCKSSRNKCIHSCIRGNYALFFHKKLTKKTSNFMQKYVISLYFLTFLLKNTNKLNIISKP